MNTEKNYSLVVRPIKKEDNTAIAGIIRKTLEEYNSALPGTAYFDKSLDDMYEAYQKKGEIYYVALLDGEIIGGAGIGKLVEEGGRFCELQKMYILPKARGKGVGRKLMEQCLEFAREAGYEKCYLETFSYMQAALKLYIKTGFYLLSKPKGNTNHTACDVWMELSLKDL